MNYFTVFSLVITFEWEVLRFTIPSKQLRELMEGKGTKSLAVVARIPESQLYNPKYLKFCPQCVAEDIKQYGETYWHRLHQVPGMGVCLTHRVRLQESSVLVANLGKAFVAADKENCVDDGKVYDEGVVQGFWEFCKKIERKMAIDFRENCRYNLQ